MASNKKNVIFFFGFLGTWTFFFFFDPEVPLLQNTLASPTPISEEIEKDFLLSKQRLHLVDEHIQPLITDTRILQAMRKVPRHLFMPASFESTAYENRPFPIGYGQSISQPSLVATMTEYLQLQPEDQVLEIGTGTGYHAAILAELAERVYTIESSEPLAESATRILKNLYGNRVSVKHGNGYWGWKEQAPFSVILVTASVDHLPPALLEQLQLGGRMLIPLGNTKEEQRLILVSKETNGTISTKDLGKVRFVPLDSQK